MAKKRRKKKELPRVKATRRAKQLRDLSFRAKMAELKARIRTAGG